MGYTLKAAGVFVGHQALDSRFVHEFFSGRGYLASLEELKALLDHVAGLREEFLVYGGGHTRLQDDTIPLATGLRYNAFSGFGNSQVLNEMQKNAVLGDAEATSDSDDLPLGMY